MSPTPSTAKTIKISVTNGVKGQPLTIVNRDNGDKEQYTLNTNGKAVVELQNLTNGYTEGHTIDFMVSGAVNGSNSLTTSGDKGESITISTSSINNTARGI